MQTDRLLLCAALAALTSACGAGVAEPLAEAASTNWPSFRGALACGTQEGWPLPKSWDLETGEHVLWRTPLPGLGHSSPVVWGERLFLTTAISAGEAVLQLHKSERDARRAYGWIKPVPAEPSHRFELICVDTRDGKVLWTRTAHRGTPFSRRHPSGTHANPSAAVDAEHVVAYFGAEGLFAYDHAGELLWQRDLGALVAGYYKSPSIQWGVASSPVIHRGRVVLLCDVADAPFLASFDVETGEELWRTARADVPTWGTPTVYPTAERTQILVNGFEAIGGYDFETGAEIWTLSGGGAVPIPTVVAAHGLFFVTSGGGVPGGRGAPAQRAPIFALRAADARGVLAFDKHLEWFEPRGGNYMASPLVYGDELYCATGSVLTCYDARTGAEHYRERVGSPIATFAASPVAGDDVVYLTKDDGTVHVVRSGPEYEVLAVNSLNESCMATPAISAGTLYFRTRGHLVAVALSPR